MEDDCDIIIIGAGIAGTACALRCARAGLSVLLLERAEIPGSKNLSGGRLYTHALAELLPQFHLTAPLERRITHESLSLLTPDGVTTFSSLQPGGESWSVLRARFDPWLVAEAEKEGVECIPGATVDALYEENGRVCGVICGDDILRARYVVLAEGANSVLAERHGLVTRPAGEAMALGIKEVLSLETSAIEERFHLENNEGAALLFSGRICDDLPGGAFLYTNQQTLSLGIVCPLSSLTQSRVSARFIPAGAGNTGSATAAPMTTSVYPRWRGEHEMLVSVNAANTGLSPLARGTHYAFLRLPGFCRFIPAGAGNTLNITYY